ncbi:sulfur carrier protein ThiS [Yoonia vestfoldensis]|uniref:Sulfur carrier protein ThiS n=1 Tax=Yoonia vestfoldensis TaxID=245188 RepID=A0A1Y0E730_9RHOB|nr:sulfur carrier protein ThiS [Yoonia vestfoldensis]ART99416.1 sulfur carrier protein ThiS [Yoonia vestfoldensis]
MKIILNAQQHDVSALTFASALDELGYSNPAIATALNGMFIPRDAREMTQINEGDRLEVLAPMQGG